MRNTLIEFMDGLREYVQESGTNIAHDERDSSEFVDTFLKQVQAVHVDGCCSEVSNKEIDKTYGHKSFIEGGLTGDKLLKK